MTQPDSRDAFERYSETARLALYYSRAALTEHGGKSIELAHLLFGLMKAEDPDLATVLSQGLALQPLSECLISTVSSSDLLDASVEVPFANETKEVLHGATVIANEYAHDLITPGHLLLSLVRRNTGPAVECLGQAGFDTGRVRAELAELLKARAHNAIQPAVAPAGVGAGVRRPLARGVSRAPAGEPRSTSNAVPLEDLWRAKSDEEVAVAARALEDYTEEGRRVILAELERRAARGLIAQPAEDGGSIESRDQAGPPDGLGGVQRLWRGYVSLPVTYWVWGVVGGLSVLIAVALVEVTVGDFVALPFGLLGIAYYVFVMVAVWRSANRHRGKKIWAQLAQVSVAASAARTVVRLLFGS